jgi:hypothetical protein
MENKDLPAHPNLYMDFDTNNNGGELYCEHKGLTKLEAASLRIMCHLMPESAGYASFNAMARDAIQAADALFDELEKQAITLSNGDD